MPNPNGSHLCGSIYNKEKQCQNLVYAQKEGMTIGNKSLKQYYVYCTAEGKCRSLGCAASFTGNSPTFCPFRKEQEERQ